MGGDKEVMDRNRDLIESCALDPKRMEYYVNFAQQCTGYRRRKDFDPEDIVQGVFASLLKVKTPLNLNKFDNYMTQSIKFRNYDWSKIQNRKPVSSFDEIESPEKLIEDKRQESISDRVNGALWEEIDGLNPTYKAPLIGHCFMHLTYEEVARRVGESVGTVKTRIYRAKAILKERLQPILQEL